tara:strand:+ start:270 stop:476 length:207 start_codon:yes stop_codon:yes gene_type:complete
MKNKYIPRTIRSVRLSAHHSAILDVVKEDIGFEWNNRAIGRALEVYYETIHMNKKYKLKGEEDENPKD